MPAGLQVFGPRTNLILDVTDRLTRVTAFGSTQPNVAGGVLIPGVGTGTPWFVVLTTPHYPYNSVYTTSIPTFTLNGNVLSWNAAPGAAEYMVGAY